MKSNSIGKNTLKVMNDLHQRGIQSYVALIRHSARHYDDIPENEHLQGLTKEGKQAAYEFGRGIQSDSHIEFYSSPIYRCVETSELIEKGFSSRGGKSNKNAVLDILGGPYINDPKKIIQMIIQSALRGKYPRFYRNWFDSKIPNELIEDSAQSAQALIDALFKLLQESEQDNRINICVTHDINLYLIKEYYLHQKPEDSAVEYLDGVIIYQKNKGYYIANHEIEEKLFD